MTPEEFKRLLTIAIYGLIIIVAVIVGHGLCAMGLLT